MQKCNIFCNASQTTVLQVTLSPPQTLYHTSLLTMPKKHHHNLSLLVYRRRPNYTKYTCIKISKNVSTSIVISLMCACVCACCKKATHSECAAWSFLRALSLAAPTGFPWSWESSGEGKSREGSLKEISTAKTT